MKKMLVVAAVAAVAFLGTASKASAASFTQCPAMGNNPGCQFLFTVAANGGITTAVNTDGTGGTDSGPYDGVEDTLFGVQNNGTTPLLFLDFGPVNDLFGFDGDGGCTFVNCGAANLHDSTGYGGFVSTTSSPALTGPFVTFSNINAALSSGRVNFGANGIPVGGSAWFTLEETFNINTVPQPGRVPEPTSLVLLGTGILAAARRLRKA